MTESTTPAHSTWLSNFTHHVQQEYRHHANRSWPASCLTLASCHRRCQRNRRWLVTTSSDGRTLLSTVNNAAGVTIIERCLTTAVVWRRSRTGDLINIGHVFFIWNQNIFTRGGGSGGGSECGNEISDANVYIVYQHFMLQYSINHWLID